MSTAWVTRQILSNTDRLVQQPPEQPRFNPRPPGVMRPGSTAEIVLQLLQKNPERLYRRRALIHATGATRKAIDWAVIFLAAQSLIDKVETPGGQLFRLHQVAPAMKRRLWAAATGEVADAPR